MGVAMGAPESERVALEGVRRDTETEVRRAARQGDALRERAPTWRKPLR
jgi:hypothetical protein